jgi:3-deoxy-D-manno-oct-2-ulosonic acid (Kdo) hydroxylase
MALPEEDRAFLTGVRQSGSIHHKNISYRPRERRVKGYERNGTDERSLARVLERYSERAVAFASCLLAPYAAGWKVDFTSFRPIEERGRQLPMKSRNDLLHVDAFPTRPTRGDRILRVFTNLNPVEPRVWLTGDRFEDVAREYAFEAGLRACAERSPLEQAARGLRALARGAGLRLPERSAYDRFMIRFHHYLKSHPGFQEGGVRSRWEFPAGSTWIVFTDGTPHAVLSGRFALEQTFIVARSDLVCPEKAPVSVLEKLCGAELRL